MANTAYVGAGTTLGTSYYMRRFYASNADARTTTSGGSGGYSKWR